MSGTQQGNPAADAGPSVETAAADIAQILARENGQPRQGERQAPRREPAPRARAEAEPQAEAEPDEALSADQLEGDADEADPEELDAGDEGEDEATEEGEETEEGQPRGRLFTVKLPDGKTERVTEQELINGYSRTQDYTRKTMALADRDRAREEDHRAARAERAQYAQLLPALIEQYQQFTEQPQIDWDRLFAENPTEYVRQQAIRRDMLDRQQAAMAEKQRLEHLTAQEEREARKVMLQNERKAVGDLVPAWKSDEKWDQARSQAKDYATSLGYTDAEIGTVTDHRAVMILWQAAQYAAMVKRGRPVPEPAPARQATAPDPGPHPLRRRTSAHTQAKQRLSQTHSVRDAAAVIRGLL